MKPILTPTALLLSILLLCACTRAQRFGLAELERRLSGIDGEYAFDQQELYRDEGVYHIFYRTVNGTLLLKVKEDDRQRISSLSLTTAGTDADTSADFSALACALTDVFLPEENRADAKGALGLADPSAFFTDETLTAEYGRYKAVFFKTTQGVSLELKYEFLEDQTGQ